MEKRCISYFCSGSRMCSFIPLKSLALWQQYKQIEWFASIKKALLTIRNRRLRLEILILCSKRLKYGTHTQTYVSNNYFTNCGFTSTIFWSKSSNLSCIPVEYQFQFVHRKDYYKIIIENFTERIPTNANGIMELSLPKI